MSVHVPSLCRLQWVRLLIPSLSFCALTCLSLRPRWPTFQPLPSHLAIPLLLFCTPSTIASTLSLKKCRTKRAATSSCQTRPLQRLSAPLSLAFFPCPNQSPFQSRPSSKCLRYVFTCRLTHTHTHMHDVERHRSPCHSILCQVRSKAFPARRCPLLSRFLPVS